MDCLIKRIIRHICCLASQIEVVFCTNFLVKFVNVHVIFALGHRARCKFLASLLVAANFGDFGGDGDSRRSRVPARARLSAPAEYGPDTSSRKPAGPTSVWENRPVLGEDAGYLPFLSTHTQTPCPTREIGEIEVRIGGSSTSSSQATSSPQAVAHFPSSFASSGLKWKLKNKWERGSSSSPFIRRLPPSVPRLHPHPISKSD